MLASLGGPPAAAFGVITGLFMSAIVVDTIRHKIAHHHSQFGQQPISPVVNKAVAWTEEHWDDLRQHAGRFIAVDPEKGILFVRANMERAIKELEEKGLSTSAAVLGVPLEEAFVQRAAQKWMEQNNSWVDLVHADRFVAVSPERGIVAVGDSQEAVEESLRSSGLRLERDATLYKIRPLPSILKMVERHAAWTEDNQAEILARLGQWFALGRFPNDPAETIRILAEADTYVALGEKCGALGVAEWAGMWYPRWLASASAALTTPVTRG